MSSAKKQHLEMTNLQQKVYEIEVWYKFFYRDEQEKDFEIHKIEATSVQDAVNKASDLYKSTKVIPFQFLHNGEKYAPNQLTKLDIYNLTAPVLC
jgi:hypothetical protein